ncbi:AAA family ATPase [Capnocytophaga canimorsus]|uniref:Endonuclease GajA/Old nuclease/RecF-like AAA domain-containing protein n=1 Tax=Capnocytophaga canimorsus (strain 5) TaxID=860228 RepID=F9YVL4_CAPCC|nr:AAA family ATPase [Capnocytophaga canimorsus]AEK24448.1 Conserved hypothetical protein [Capnocytophaga canimorsus Cc5]
MNEYLELKDFGPIKALNLEIKPLMVFIGESGSGKSAILKLMSLIRWVHKQNNLHTFFEKEFELREEYFQELLANSEILEFFNEKTQFNFTIDGAKYQYKEQKFIFDKVEKQKITFDKIAFLSESRILLPNVLGRQLNYNAIFPFFLEDTLYNFDKAREKLKKGNEFKLSSTEQYLKQNSENQFFVKGNNFEIRLENASSGTKTAFSLELIVDYFTQKYDYKEILDNALRRFRFGTFSTGIDIHRPKNLSIFVEEPELSLFPSAQRRLINRLIKDCFVENRHINCTTRLAFATHSPYILASLNNLLLAGELASLKPERKGDIDEVVSDRYWLTMKQIGVYFIQDGILKSAMDEEEKMIDGNFLDAISEEISEEFSKLLDIQYEN